MTILLFFAFISGLITILAPCIWPILPIVLSSSTVGGKRRPLGITLGIVSSFAFFTLTLSYIVKIIPLDPDTLRFFSVVVIGFLGLSLIIPKLSQILEGYVSRLTGKLSPTETRDGFVGGYITGFFLGIVWSPCAGPILATIATLAATRAVNFQIILVTLAYVIGVGIPLLLFAEVGSRLFTKSRFVAKYTGSIQKIFGIVMILTAVLIFTNYDKVLQTKLLDRFPSYSRFIFDLEGNSRVKQELTKLRGNKSKTETPGVNINMVTPQAQTLPVLGTAPEFVGISRWLNTDKPITLEKVRGKVVLVDFWTYTCINCIRTLPHITAWHEKYKDKGLIVVGVHTPEFEFEKKTENVQAAMRQYNIQYPVAQDNDYATWKAYDNHYWPAKYLIDHTGKVRYLHYGEGSYEETEKAIQSLLTEAGQTIDEKVGEEEQRDLSGKQTPETYLGLLRMDRFGGVPTPKLGTQSYSAQSSLPVDHFAFTGPWTVAEEYSQSAQGSSLTLRFLAKDVFLVMRPLGKPKVAVSLDGQKITDNYAGADVQDGSIVFDTNNPYRLYHVITLPQKGEHLLDLTFDGEVQVYAFTFGS